MTLMQSEVTADQQPASARLVRGSQGKQGKKEKKAGMMEPSADPPSSPFSPPGGPRSDSKLHLSVSQTSRLKARGRLIDVAHADKLQLAPPAVAVFLITAVAKKKEEKNLKAFQGLLFFRLCFDFSYMF